MQSFYKAIPPPGENDGQSAGSCGYLIRGSDKRENGPWIAVACGILCLSIVVALIGVMGGKSWPRLKSFVPVSLGTTPAASVVTGTSAQATFQTATNPLRWTDLTLMLRTGLSDDEIIAAIATKQLVVPIGAVQEGELRELGAGSRLLAALRGRRLYAAPDTDAPPSAVPVANAAPRATGVALPMLAQPPVAYYSAPPVDYAARDRQVASLQTHIDELDERIRRIRTNPDQYWYHRDYGVNRQQGMDRYLNQLDKERNELRRQKWQLEGR